MLPITHILPELEYIPLSAWNTQAGSLISNLTDLATDGHCDLGCLTTILKPTELLAWTLFWMMQGLPPLG